MGTWTTSLLDRFSREDEDNCKPSGRAASNLADIEIGYSAEYNE
jgi:hypothetical protein